MSDEEDLLKEIERAGLGAAPDGVGTLKHKVPAQPVAHFEPSRERGEIEVVEAGGAGVRIAVEIFSLQREQSEFTLFSGSKVLPGSVVQLQRGADSFPVQVLSCTRVQGGRVLTASGAVDRFRILVKRYR